MRTRRNAGWLGLLCGLLLCAGAPALGQAGSAQADAEKLATPPPVGVYLGREVARTMHYSGARWLTRESREREEGTRLLLEHLGVTPGMTVCDLGCGNGFYSLKLAPMVGDEGRVLAVDIQPEMLDLLRERADGAGVRNIEPVLGTTADPKLEPGSVDLALLVDVYHEFDHPEQMLAKLRRALAPRGRIVLVEFRAEDPAVPIKPEHKMSRAQVLLEMQANGFVLADEFDGLPWQHLLSFTVESERPGGSGEAMFNGETLDGWHALQGGEWSVEDGVLVGRSSRDEARHGLLVTDEEYDDFLVVFEYRLLRGNSGFYFRSEESGDEVGVHGFQVEVDDVTPGGLYETGGRAWVVQPGEELADQWQRPGEWNTVKLFAEGEHVEVFVNGWQTAVIDDPEGRCAGRFALQLHGGMDMRIEFRDLRLWHP